MAASSISIAAATSVTSTLVRLCNRITCFSSFDCSTITRILLIQKSNSSLLRLKTQNPFSPLLPLLSHSHLCHSSSTFDNFEYTEDSESNLGEDPEEEEEEEEEEEQRESLSVAAEERRLYVGNLPYAMTSSQLAEIFGESGRIDSIEIVYDRVTDRSRGFGFVTMGSPEEAKEAIRMFDGSQVGGRTVKVNFPEVPRGAEREVMGPKIRSSYRGFVDSPYKIYAGNLSWNLTSTGLRDAFADQPGLLSAKIIYDRDSGKSRGYGFVSFASSEEAQAAIDAINGVEVEGRPLRLNLAEGRTATSSSTLERSIETDLKASEMVSN